MTDITKPTRRQLDLSRIEAPTVNAPMSHIAGGAWAGAMPHRYAGFVHRLAVWTLVAQPLAANITQEAFASLSEHPERIEPKRGTTASRAGTWCMTISTPSWPSFPRYATATST